MRIIFFFFKIILFIGAVGLVLWWLLLREPYPETVTYGVSFNTLYARELNLDWEKVYSAILTDLEVKHLRLAAHWPMVMPKEDEWNFEELDTQMALAEAHGAKVVLAVGRRLPRWPECHVPTWAKEKSWDEQKAILKTYIETVVNRYKDNSALEYWQVENEPFLTVYAKEECGALDKAFLDEEIELVKALDPEHPILVTDSGNLGMWIGAYRRGDVFGTSVYVHLWNEATGPIKTVLPPETYILKRKLMGLIFGKKDTFLIELSVEPWLNLPIVEADIETQLTRMNAEKFEQIIAYARDTRFDRQYLWGAEWWYWLKETQDHPELWERAKQLYTE
jgi:hypothetical protein